MKSELTKKQLQKMYAHKNESESSEKASPFVNMQPSGNESVIVEIKGGRTQLPTYSAYQNLKEQNDALKTSLLKSETEIRQLKHVVNQLTQAVNQLQEDIKVKVDKPDA